MNQAVESERFFVLTGGPGSGKSTLLAALVEEGFAVMPEAGRAVIREQVAAGGRALPWDDRAAFADLMLERDIHSYMHALALPGLVLFDRGIPDVLGYLRLCDMPVPAAVDTAARIYRYNTRVFLAPHWPEIFTQDAERKQTPEEAAATTRVMEEVYAGLGYTLVTLPLVSVNDRVRFVRDTCTR